LDYSSAGSTYGQTGKELSADISQNEAEMQRTSSFFSLTLKGQPFTLIFFPEGDLISPFGGRRNILQ
jgi:hypothetical protein